MITQIGQSSHIIDDQVTTDFVIIILATTLISPFLMQFSFQKGVK